MVPKRHRLGIKARHAGTALVIAVLAALAFGGSSSAGLLDGLPDGGGGEWQLDDVFIDPYVGT